MADMKTFEISYGDKRYSVDAPDQETALSAIRKQFQTPGKLGELERSEQATADEIAKRGQISIEGIRSQLQKPGIVPKALGGIQAISAPLRAVEASIANPLLEIQRGNLSPETAFKEFKAGITGKKLGEYGDLMRSAGANEPIAATTGFIAGFLSPLTVMGRGIKALKGLNKFTDRGIRSAGKSLIAGADEATDIVGKKLNYIYAGLNDIKVDGNKAVDVIADLPNPVLIEIEEQLGKKIDDVLIDPSIADMRTMKKVIGEFRPTAFGKETKGAMETLEGKKINRVYGALKNLVRDTISSSKGKKVADILDSADNAFTETKRSADFIRRAITDPVLLKPTKAGKTAVSFKKSGDVSTREALKILRQAGGSAKKNINKAIQDLENYNKITDISNISEKLLKYGIYGGVAGTAGSRAFRGISGRYGE